VTLSIVRSGAEFSAERRLVLPTKPARTTTNPETTASVHDAGIVSVWTEDDVEDVDVKMEVGVLSEFSIMGAWFAPRNKGAHEFG